jgi:Ni/Co efflux regulator RcnB
MKKLILLAAAASVLAAAPAAAAPRDAYYDRGRVEQVQRTKYVAHANGRHVVAKKKVVKTRQVQTRHWQKGQRFDNRYAKNHRVIQNPRAYRLQDAPRGYRWVQSDNDAVLVAITSGIIGAVIGNMF